MNSVEIVKALCKERKVPISKLEKTLGFGNGYVSQLKKGTFPSDRLSLIAEYFNVSVDYLLGNEEKTSPAKSPEDETLEELLERLKNRKEMRMLFKLADNATKEDVERAVAIIEALQK